MITSDDDAVDCQRMIFGPMLCGLIQGCCKNDRALTDILLKVNGMHDLGYMETRH